MKFNISCFYDEHFHCDVDDGFAPALPGKTTCQFFNRNPVPCKMCKTENDLMNQDREHTKIGPKMLLGFPC